MMKIGFRHLTFCSAIALCSTPAFAADEEQASPASEASPTEILVTAQRREERLRDVPIALVALTGESLARSGISSAEDLGNVTPGLNFATQGAFGQPTIRGIGTSVTGPGSDANVAIYVDGVYQPNQTANLFDFNNIERVEVLKGPQGTLFGRNATGGAIRIMTADPDQTLSGNFSASLGRFNDVKLTSFINLPLGDEVALNVAGLYKSNDGYVDNVVTGRALGDARTYSGRAKLKIDATDRLSFIIAGSFSDTSDTAPFAVKPINNNNVAVQQGVVFPGGFYTVALNEDVAIRTKAYLASLTANYNLDVGTINSITSYQKFTPFVLADIDNGPRFDSSVILDISEDNFTQELNFSSDLEGPFNFVTGLFYYRNTSSTNLISYAGSIPPPSVFVDLVGTVKTNAISAYAEANYQIAEKLQLTGGLRLSSERKQAIGSVGAFTLVDTNKRWNSWTPRAVIRYSLDDTSNVYASYSRGFKSGNYNILFFDPTPVRPETVDAYEIGYKHSSGGLSVNASAFYYDYKDIQVQIQTNQGGTAVAILQNAAAAKIWGADLDLTLPISKNFTLQGGAAYTHARYKNFKDALLTYPLVNASGVPIGGNSQTAGDASNNNMIRTPEWTANVSGTYTAPLGGGSLETTLTGSYNGGFFWDVGNSIKEDPYFLLSARVSWQTQDKRYRISIWGNNLTNTQYSFYANNTQTGNSYAPAKPLTAGVAFETSF